MPQATELVGVARVDAAEPAAVRSDLLHGLGELVDLTEFLEEQRELAAAIRRYQADLRRDPTIASTLNIRRNLAQRRNG